MPTERRQSIESLQPMKGRCALVGSCNGLAPVTAGLDSYRKRRDEATEAVFKWRYD